MHCSICDIDTDSVTLAQPCAECVQVIQDCLASYPPIEEGEIETVDPEYDVGC